jgi:hypothetical protein
VRQSFGDGTVAGPVTENLKSQSKGNAPQTSIIRKVKLNGKTHHDFRFPAAVFPEGRKFEIKPEATSVQAKHTPVRTNCIFPLRSISPARFATVDPVRQRFACMVAGIINSIDFFSFVFHTNRIPLP